MLRASPIPTLFAMVIFFAVAAASRIVSLASITASVGFLIGTLLYFKFTHTFSVPALISAIVILFVSYLNKNEQSLTVSDIENPLI